MAPPRRKGSGRAAAAAAAASRQQWKVGDLVLAKMKGFPAWPAMISDPKKWGYSSHKKKLLVFFFGTKQIAFCNHVEIEAFTEEKKRTLLTKRQGKCADFVRAVDEIVASFDILQSHKYEEKYNLGNEGIPSDIANLDNSNYEVAASSNYGPLPCSNQSEGHESFKHGIEELCIDDSPLISVTHNDSQTHDTKSEPLIEKVSILDELRQTSLAANTSFRKRSRDMSPPMRIMQKHHASILKTRSSVRADPSKLQQLNRFASKLGSKGINSMPDTSQSQMVLENRSNSSVDNSVCQDVNVDLSTGIFLSGCISQDGDLMVVESASQSVLLDESDALYSNCGDECSTKGLDERSEINFYDARETKTLVIMKNTKSNKTLISQSTTTDIILDEVSSKAHNVKNCSDHLCKRIMNGSGSGDGDEHLPLVKRARARLHVSPKEDTISGASLGAENTILINQFDHDNKLSLSTSNPMTLNNAEGARSSECFHLKESDMLLKGNAYNLKGSTVDVEAALPPSKRLHRALEAMSANAAEAKIDGTEPLSAQKKCTPMPSIVSVILEDCTRMITPEHDMKNSDRMVDTSCPSQSSMISTSTGIELAKPSLVVGASSVGKKERGSSQPEECINVNVVVDQIDSWVNGKIVKTDSPTEIFDDSLPKRSQQMDDTCIKNPSSSKREEKELMQTENDNNDDANKCREVFSDVVKLEEQYKSEASLSSGSISGSSAVDDENLELRKITQGATDPRHIPTPKDAVFSPNSAPTKALNAVVQDKRLLSQFSFSSYSVSDAKPSSECISSPSHLGNEDSSVRLFASSERTDYLLHGSSRSPDFTMHQKDGTHQEDRHESQLDFMSVNLQKCSNKLGHAKATTTLKSFESVLYTLTRTKDSIGRATRRAVECAKHGVANEAVELILCKLEREQSLHRRVDLFFLVDSIMRNSQGQKGVVGDAFPSIFQRVLGCLLAAVAPPGDAACDNRRQCLKVLKLWIERKTFPEFIIRHHIRELDSANECSYANSFSRRPLRTERALDDPVREMEGILVDEYGSNTNFQLPALLDSNNFKNEDNGSDVDEKSFEAVTPEAHPKIHYDNQLFLNSSTEKHKHILEDVDGELEMEDVAPSSEIESISNYHVVRAETRYSYQFNEQLSFPLAPPLPIEKPPSPPPLPSSPPPAALCSPSPVIPSHPLACNSATDINVLKSCSITTSLPPHLSQHTGLSLGAAAMDHTPLDTSIYCALGNRGSSTSMSTPISSFCSCSYATNCCSHVPPHPGVKNSQVEPSAKKGYHLQPPRRSVSNQFSFVQTEAQHQNKSWRKGSSPSLSQSYPFNHDPHGSACSVGSVQNDCCVLSAAIPPDQSWSHPPMGPNYKYRLWSSAAENCGPRVVRAPSYWRSH